jgi:CPA1 family monovalent cation:H+ antiporter
MFNIAASCLAITVLLAYLNHRFIKMPTAIGVMATALVGLDAMCLAYGLREYEASLLRSIDFSDVLMQGMLSMLLFAGALRIDLSELKAYRWQIGGLAVLGTVLSTLAVGYGMWWALPLVGLPLPLVYCLLFGALISPTDPIAVMGILKSAHAPKELELVIAGESLFNDGVGVVIFSLLLGMLTSGLAPTPVQGLELLLHEAGGGLCWAWCWAI